jgi:hypothetical protein
MELFLNLLWVTIAALVTAVWRMRWARQRRRILYSPIQQRLALGCAFLFLFFCVSLSDDLHSEVIVVESAGRRHSPVLTSPDHSAHGTGAINAQGTAMLPYPAPPVLLRQTCRLWSLLEMPSLAFEQHCAHGLSPPASAF